MIHSDRNRLSTFSVDYKFKTAPRPKQWLLQNIQNILFLCTIIVLYIVFNSKRKMV